MELVFEETELTNLKQYLASIDAVSGMVPTEVRWQLRGDNEKLIQKPTVKIEQWMPN